MTIKNYKMFIDGEWVGAVRDKTFASYDPSTGKVWASFPEADKVDVDKAVTAADTAFRSKKWQALTATKRGELLRNLSKLCEENIEQLADLETLDNGKLIRETRGQASFLPEFLNYFAGLADKVEGAVLPVNKADMFCYSVRQAVGVVAAIVPWNSPLYLTVLKLAPAIAAGNTLVIKPSEHASATLLELANLAQKAGFPAGVINVITGYGHTTGDALTKHPKISRIAFTGGIGGARQIIRNSAENLSKVTVELGGKSPNIVFEDADIESAVNGVVAGIFAASGQSCVAGSRVLVHKDIKPEFLERLTDRARSIVIGSPRSKDSEMGPIATAQQLQTIEDFVERAKGEGARLHYGGERHSSKSDGWFYCPTIFDCDHEDYEIVREEIFGPVASILTFENEEEALQKANNSKYGLGAGVWTKSLARAHRMVSQIHSGIVWVNTYRAVSPMAPIGGFHDSGYGREGGIDAINEYTDVKTVWINMSEETMPDPFIMR